MISTMHNLEATVYCFYLFFTLFSFALVTIRVLDKSQSLKPWNTATAKTSYYGSILSTGTSERVRNITKFAHTHCV